MNYWSKIYVVPLLLTASLAQASQPGGITVGGTRLIYNGSKKEAALNITNTDSKPFLIQSWGENQPGVSGKVPFIVTPPLFRLEGQQQNILRIVRAGGNLPEDRESLYWLNIKSIPSGDAQSNSNTLQIAVKTRIKLIYRPKLLKGKPEDVTTKLIWEQTGSRLVVSNPTPFVMNFNKVKVGGQEIKDATYVMPMSKATFTAPAGAHGTVTWKLITDYGGLGAEHSSSQ